MAQVAISASAMPRATDTASILHSDGEILAEAAAQSGAGPASSESARTLVGEINHSPSGVIESSLAPGGGDRITLFKEIAGYPAYVVLGLDRPAILATWYRNVLVYGLVTIAAATGIVLALGLALRWAREEGRAVGRWRAEIQQREDPSALAPPLPACVEPRRVRDAWPHARGLAHIP